MQSRAAASRNFPSSVYELVSAASLFVFAFTVFQVDSAKALESIGKNSHPPSKNTVEDSTRECNTYVERLRGRILDNWDLPEGKHLVTLNVIVNADGSTGDVSSQSNQSNAPAEQAALAAFVKAQPLEPLPRSLGDKAKLKLEFESMSNLHGDSDCQLRVWLNPGN